jgi:Mg2+ and Co2+ transporter CorA
MNNMHESSARPPPEVTGDANQGMVINCAAYRGGCRVADIDLDQARKVDTSDGGFVWIGLHEPDQPLLRTVQQRFGLHDLAIEDALSAHQRPKLELYGDTLFIVVLAARELAQQKNERHDNNAASLVPGSAPQKQ